MTFTLPRRRVDLPTANGPQSIAYFDRPGPGAPIVFVHGLGNAAANFDHLALEPALAPHRLIALDFPGCGASPYPDGRSLSISDATDILAMFVDALGLGRFLIVGASMGGLTALLYAERHPERLLGFVNAEGNLAPEDCMFSRLATPHSYQHFEQHVFPGIKAAVRARNNRGFREHLKVLEIADPRAYYDYSAQLVADSDSNTLIERFLALPTPRHFVYGDANRGLPYLPRLRAGQCTVVELADADHFMFYDDPAAFAECVARAAGP